MFVAIFYCCNKLVDRAECGGSEDSGAFRGPVKARLVMLHASMESLDVFVFVLMVVGVCCRIAWRMVGVTSVGMSESGMLVDHLVCLLARRSRP